MSREPHDVIGWIIIHSSVSVQDEVVIVEVAVLRGGVTSSDQPRKRARYGSIYETRVEKHYILSGISAIIPARCLRHWNVPGVNGHDIIICGVSHTPDYISIKLETVRR